MSRTITSIIFLATAAAVFFTWTKPYFEETKTLESQKASLEEILSNSRQIQELRDNLLAQYNDIPQDNLERLNKMLPDHPDSIKFIIELNNVLNNNGMLLKNIDVNDAKSEEKPDFGQEQSIETMEFTIKTTGSYGSFYSFLKDLERDLRLVNINSLNFVSSETDSYEFNITGSAYWKK